jgi:hypothetical protein
MRFARLLLPGLGLLAAALVCRADGPQTVVAPGLFSYQAPLGWTAQDSPISKYKVSFAPPANGFAANINVVIETAAVSLNDYVTGSLSQLKATPMLTNVKVVSQQPFQTAGGLDGQRVVVTDTMGKINMQQTFYFFDGGSNAKLVVTASCLAADGAADAPLFDTALKTFTLE